MPAFFKKAFKNVIFRRLVIIAFSLVLFVLAMIVGLNLYIVGNTKNRIITAEEALGLGDFDCILVLGCAVRDSGPSLMLTDRLGCGVELYHLGAAPKLLMSGDHGRVDYDEVNTMKEYAISASVPSEDVFMDHAGFSTYDSLYRAEYIFGAKRILIVSQKYHLYRALHIADALGIEAFGVSAEDKNYRGEEFLEIREMLARVKDTFMCIFDMPPVCLGDTIPISGSGDATNDQ